MAIFIIPMKRIWTVADEMEDAVELIPATKFDTFFSAAFCNLAFLKILV
jgi:hypothetical protein